MSNQKSLNYILKGTSKAINEVSGKFYVDCYVDEILTEKKKVCLSLFEKN